jgi:hypothetical protein
VLTVSANASVVEARLRAGGYACPDRGCGGSLGPWGWARERVVEAGARGRGPAGRVRVRPRRARCRVCGATHVLLAVLFFSRRADSAAVIARAVELAVGGWGFRRIAKLLARPPTTVRDWLRSARAAASAGAGVLWAVACEAAPDPASVAPAPSGSLLGGLVSVCSALGAAVAARLRVDAPEWQSAAAAACRSRFLQASGGGAGSQHELALPPAWWRAEGWSSARDAGPAPPPGPVPGAPGRRGPTPGGG